MATQAYRPVPGHVLERIQIAILCQEQMDLHWEDEATAMNYLQRVQLLELTSSEAGEYLEARVLSTGEVLRIRLDLIKNLPMPVK
ncbi:MAG: hypothetical protein ACOY5C_07705 [Pseudomonadota bacterium]|uniref:hypothetical protein n=1 Tax=Thermithiobacillus tepidarius TaxID=929 RepID=UPI00041FDD79|nr:hypothetical protein [Thermithiobacillus tepidarius]